MRGRMRGLRLDCILITIRMGAVISKTINNSFKKIVKLREREGQRVDPGRSLKGHLWMVDGGWWISFP